MSGAFPRDWSDKLRARPRILPASYANTNTKIESAGENAKNTADPPPPVRAFHSDYPILGDISCSRRVRRFSRSTEFIAPMRALRYVTLRYVTLYAFSFILRREIVEHRRRSKKKEAGIKAKNAKHVINVEDTFSLTAHPRSRGSVLSLSLSLFRRATHFLQTTATRCFREEKKKTARRASFPARRSGSRARARASERDRCAGRCTLN